MAASEDVRKDPRIIQENYLSHIREFVESAQQWLPAELEIFESVPDRTIRDASGEYRVGQFTISRKNVPEPDNVVAGIFPQGATTMIGEGVLEIVGSLGSERLRYFRKDTIPLIQSPPGKQRPFYLGVEKDGWYWLEYYASIRAIPLTRELLLNFLRIVSFYEVAE